MSDSTTHIALGPGGEFDRVRAIWRRLGTRAAPSGDDCAIVKIGSERLAISTDISVQGTHFMPGWLRLDEIGYRAATAALSDLAAVAAEPAGVLVSLGISEEVPEEDGAEVMDGVGEAAASVGAKVWGGDLVRSLELVLDVVVVGRLDAAPLSRSGASPGQELFVTGALGGPAAAVDAWLEGREPDSAARERFARPTARVSEARWLRDHGAKALIDLSDGLAPDAGQLSAASGVSCVIQLDAVPVHTACRGPEQAVVSGEEYELLVALSASAAKKAVPSFVKEFGIPLTCVGRVEAGSGVTLERNGVTVGEPLPFKHF